MRHANRVNFLNIFEKRPLLMFVGETAKEGSENYLNFCVEPKTKLRNGSNENVSRKGLWQVSAAGDSRSKKLKT